MLTGLVATYGYWAIGVILAFKLVFRFEHGNVKAINI